MDQSKINEAVIDCVRQALGAHKPLTALQSAVDQLRSDDWPNAELDIVRNTCVRMREVIYDGDGSEAKDQAE